MTDMYAKVVIPGLALDMAFDYILDEDQQKQALVGQRVWVQLGARRAQGIIVAITDKTSIKKLKKIISIESTLRPVPADLLRLTRLVADNYYASWGEALQGCLARKPAVKKTNTPKPRNTGTMSLPGLLPENQIEIKDSLQNWLRQKDVRPLLLWGSSLDTRIRVYVEMLSTILANNSQVLILFPEIDLLQSYEPLFEQRYGECVGTVHSHLPPGQLSTIWEQIHSNQKRLILATRMALFYPFSQLSLIVVEQEHDPAYKSDQKPMYHARDVTLLRQELFHTPVLLASDTPSVESYYCCRQKKYIELHVDPDTENNPSFRLIKMKEQDVKKEHFFLTPPLLEAIKERLERDEKVLIFANMRGFAGLVMCRMCGKVRQCPRCELALSWSKETNTLSCRHCNFQTKFKEECPECDSHHYRTFGLGLEAVAEKIKKTFTEARVGILDSTRFNAGFDTSCFDIIVGTQILNKMSTYPRATLLGVLLIDVLLNVPDFRGGERVFQSVFSLTRKLDCSMNNAQVLIQSYNSDHYVIKSLLENKPEIFYNQDLYLREELHYPPFGAMVEILIKGKDKEKVVESAGRLCVSCADNHVTILGPAPAYREKVRGEYRQRIFFLAKDKTLLIQLLRARLAPGKQRASTMKVIVDPVELS